MRRSRSECLDVSVSTVSELAWLTDLVTQTAPYAEPATDELDHSLLPGVAALRAAAKTRFDTLWQDSITGCPELLVAADQCACLMGDGTVRLFRWLSTLPTTRAGGHYELLTEPAQRRRHVRHRLERLDGDVQLRRRYRDLLREIWDLAAPVWRKRGQAVAGNAVREWRRRVAGASLEQLLPPRHPLIRNGDRAARTLLTRRRGFSLAPMFFSMSGGHAVDLGDRIHIGVPASSLEPIRQVRDSVFVADRMRLLSEPTRVRILIHLLSAPAAVMQTARALRISQPTVSGHLRAMQAAGLVQVRRRRGRNVFAASRARIERNLEDARATLLRWS